jgi:GTP-binding protein
MNQSWSLVDLPGYGFAKAAKNEKFDFNERAGDYLEGRANLRRVFTLIDSRHKPQRIDLDFLEWLGGTGVPYSLVFTKTDKQSPAKTRASIALFLEALAPVTPEVLASSAKSRDGRLDILRAIGRGLAE